MTNRAGEKPIEYITHSGYTLEIYLHTENLPDLFIARKRDNGKIIAEESGETALDVAFNLGYTP